MFLGLLHAVFGPRKYARKTVTVNGRRIRAYVADSFLKKMFGLMYVTIGNEEGMLFPFGWESRQMTAITMMNMRYAIDIVWLDRGRRVVDIVERARPETSVFSQSYVPEKGAMYVLELRAGCARRLRIRKGTTVSIR